MKETNEEVTITIIDMLQIKRLYWDDRVRTYHHPIQSNPITSHLRILKQILSETYEGVRGRIYGIGKQQHHETVVDVKGREIILVSSIQM